MANMIAKIVTVVAIIAILFVSFIFWAVEPGTGIGLAVFGVGIPLIVAFIVKHEQQSDFWITFASGLGIVAIVAAFLMGHFISRNF